MLNRTTRQKYMPACKTTQSIKSESRVRYKTFFYLNSYTTIDILCIF